MANLIIITGAPGAGKTTIAKGLKQELGWPLIAKDDIKEHFFKEIEVEDEDFNFKLSDVARSLAVYFSELLAEINTSFIVEGNFASGEFSSVFNRLADKYGLDIYQVFCTGNPENIIKRYNERHSAGERGGHNPTMDQRGIDKYDHPLELSGDLTTVNDLRFDAKKYIEDKRLLPGR